jgi:hypothetical protein
MRASGVESATSNVSGKKRKGGQPLNEIKSKLTKLLLPSHEKKSVVELRLKLAEEIQEIDASKTVGENWTIQELTTVVAFLPGADPELWEPSYVRFLQPIINRRCYPHNPAPPEDIVQKVNEIFKFHRTKFSRPVDRPRKVLQVTADELVPMMQALANKPAAKWGEKEVALLRSDFSQVSTIDANRSSANSINMYLTFFKELSAFYIRRPDIRAQLDPDVVIFDLRNADINVYKQELARYSMPPHHGAFPEPWGANTPALVFPMPCTSPPCTSWVS